MKQPANDATSAPKKPAALARMPEGVHCLECGYDLRGSTSPCCPECGFALELLRASESQIPWTHRRQLGFWRAYRRTVWMVTFRGRKFCAEGTHSGDVRRRPELPLDHDHAGDGIRSHSAGRDKHRQTRAHPQLPARHLARNPRHGGRRARPGGDHRPAELLLSPTPPGNATYKTAQSRSATTPARR